MNDTSMGKSLNFRTLENQQTYIEAYEESLKLVDVTVTTKYIKTSIGTSHIICCGDEQAKPLVLLHASSCGSTIFYKNFTELSQYYHVYAIDLIGECSMSLLMCKIKNIADYALWLDETLTGLGLEQVILGGLSIGGWTAANYAGFYPKRVEKLILISPVQTFAKMYSGFFLKIMKMGFQPTRENIEEYIGWGSEKETKEAALPDSILELFRSSINNMSGNVFFPRWLKTQHLARITMPTLVLFGEHEFAFSVIKAKKRAAKIIRNLDMEVVADASHMIPISKSEYVNKRIIEFIEKTKTKQQWGY